MAVMPLLSMLTLLVAFLLSTGILRGINTKACVQKEDEGHAIGRSSMRHIAAMLLAALAN